jgi:hypothetical protein
MNFGMARKSWPRLLKGTLAGRALPLRSVVRVSMTGRPARVRTESAVSKALRLQNRDTGVMQVSKFHWPRPGRHGRGRSGGRRP